MQDRFLRYNVVVDRTGIAKSTIYYMMKQGRFPKPIRISLRAVRWRESDIVQFMESPTRWMLDQVLNTQTIKDDR